MAALTWRDVAAPDLRTSLQGYEQFSNLLNGALGGAEKTLTNIDDSKSERVNAQLMAKIAQAGSVEEAEALASEAFANPDVGNRVTAQTASMLMGRKGQVLQDDTLANTLDFNRYTQGRTKTDNANLDAARTDASRYLALSMAGDDTGAAALYRDSATLKGLNPAQLLDLANGGQGLTKGNVDIAGARQDQTIQLKIEGRDAERFGWDRVGFTNEQEDRQADIAAEGVAAYALQGGGGDAEGTRASFMEAAGKLSPRARFKAMQMINSNLGSGIFGADELSAVGGDASTFSGANAGSDPTRVMNYQARAVGFGSVPDSVKTLGQASEFAKQVNRAGADSSAMGVYQIVGQTMRGDSKNQGYAEKVFGKNWQNVEFNFENQDKMAEAIFNDNRGSAAALRKQWVSLSPAEAERVRKMPWKQAREYIAQGESSASPATLGNATVAIAAEAEGRSMQNNRDGMTGDFVKYAKDPRTASEVVNDLIGTAKAPGVFYGTNRGFLLTQLNAVSRKSKANPAIAGAILSRNVSEKRDLPLDRFGRNIRWAGSWLGLSDQAQPDLPGGIRLNEAGINNAIKNYDNGRVYDRLSSNAVQEQTAPQIIVLQNEYKQAAAQLAVAQKRAATGGISPANLERIAAFAEAKRRAWQNGVTKFAGSKSDRAERAPPPPKTLSEKILGFDILDW